MKPVCISCMVDHYYVVYGSLYLMDVLLLVLDFVDPILQQAIRFYSINRSEHPRFEEKNITEKQKIK